jgi:hypothetical protein
MEHSSIWPPAHLTQQDFGAYGPQYGAGIPPYDAIYPPNLRGSPLDFNMVGQHQAYRPEVNTVILEEFATSVFSFIRYY